MPGGRRCPPGLEPQDLAARRRAETLHNDIWTEPLFAGGYPAHEADTWPVGMADGAWRLPGDLDLIGVPLDFAGLNFYQPLTVAAAPHRAHDPERRSAVDVGVAEVDPYGYAAHPAVARLPRLRHPLAADDQRPVSAWADGVELRVHAFADGAERTVVIPRPDGPGETTRFHAPRRRPDPHHHRQRVPLAAAHRRPGRHPAQQHRGTLDDPLPLHRLTRDRMPNTPPASSPAPEPGTPC